MAPTNPNLPGGGGESITVYNLNAAKRGIVNNVLTFSDNNSRVYNGVEFSVNARVGRGGFIFGGVLIGIFLLLGAARAGERRSRRFHQLLR